MKIELRKFEPIPSNIYVVKFVGVDEVDTQYGGALRWTFSVAQGEHKDKSVNVLTARHATTKNNTGKMLTVLTGSLEVDPESVVGEMYAAKVDLKDGGEFNSIVIIKKIPSKTVKTAPTTVDTGLCEEDFVAELITAGLN